MNVIPKRRKIREIAVQFLYLADLEEGPEAGAMQEAFWQMTQESSLRKLSKAKAKAILHLANGRDTRSSKLAEDATLCIAQLQASQDSGQLASLLKKMLNGERRLDLAIAALKSVLQSKSDASPDQEISSVLEINQELDAMQKCWHEELAKLPDWRTPLEPVTVAIERLSRISARITAIDNPDSSLGDFSHLQTGKEEIEALRRDTQSLVKSILTHKDHIDQTLASIIENYHPERVDPVDRAILRLSSYEILHCDDIPRAVAINEAIEIARKYGTAESARFINGVLDAL